MRDGLLFLHIIGAAGWLGGAIYAAYTYSTLAKAEPSAAGPALGRLKKVEDRYFGPVTGLVLLSGVGLVLTSDAFGWGDAFVLIGLGAILVSGILNGTVFKGSTDRLIEASSAGSGVTEALHFWQRGVGVDVVILLVVVWAMVSKLGA